MALNIVGLNNIYFIQILYNTGQILCVFTNQLGAQILCLPVVAASLSKSHRVREMFPPKCPMSSTCSLITGCLPSWTEFALNVRLLSSWWCYLRTRRMGKVWRYWKQKTKTLWIKEVWACMCAHTRVCMSESGNERERVLPNGLCCNKEGAMGWLESPWNSNVGAWIPGTSDFHLIWRQSS